MEHPTKNARRLGNPLQARAFLRGGQAPGFFCFLHPGQQARVPRGNAPHGGAHNQQYGVDLLPMGHQDGRQQHRRQHPLHDPTTVGRRPFMQPFTRVLVWKAW